MIIKVSLQEALKMLLTLPSKDAVYYLESAIQFAYEYNSNFVYIEYSMLEKKKNENDRT